MAISGKPLLAFKTPTLPYKSLQNFVLIRFEHVCKMVFFLCSRAEKQVGKFPFNDFFCNIELYRCMSVKEWVLLKMVHTI